MIEPDSLVDHVFEFFWHALKLEVQLVKGHFDLHRHPPLVVETQAPALLHRN